MIEKITSWLINRTSFMSQDTEELSVLELTGKMGAKINELVDEANGRQEVLDNAIDGVMLEVSKKVDMTYLTEQQYLSADGDFTGSLDGTPLTEVFNDIANSLSLSNVLIGMVNDRESIGTIYDGGDFETTDPPTITVDGGVYTNE